MKTKISIRFDKVSSLRKTYSLQRVAFNFVLIFLILKISLLYPYAQFFQILNCYCSCWNMFLWIQLIFRSNANSLNCEFAQVRIRSTANSLKWEFAQLRIAQVRIAQVRISQILIPYLAKFNQISDILKIAIFGKIKFFHRRLQMKGQGKRHNFPISGDVPQTSPLQW